MIIVNNNNNNNNNNSDNNNGDDDDKKKKKKKKKKNNNNNNDMIIIIYNNNNNNNNDDDNDSNNYDNAIERRNARLVPSPHGVTNCLQHAHTSDQGAVMCKSRATLQVLIMCNMLCDTWCRGTAQLLRVTELKSHLF